MLTDAGPLVSVPGGAPDAPAGSPEAPADGGAGDAPRVVTTFAEFGLSAPVLQALQELGYVTPTPIQSQAIPVVLSGRDVMGAAQTGTGKTAGFALPIIHKLLPLASTSASPARHPVRALVLAPTRELADQIHQNVQAYVRHTPLRAGVVFGGVDMQPQTAMLRRGVEILTATPGRLLDHVQQRTLQLGQVKLLVLDEADRMLDMGFLPDIQRILQLLSRERQSLMFSATFSEEIRKLAGSFLKNPQVIEVARRNALADTVEQTVYQVESDELKRAAVSHLLRTRGIEQVIVFSNTKLGASRLARQLESDGLLAGAIHGDKSQAERLQTLAAFKAGGVRVLVATDVAARGLDIAELPAVINFDLPHSPEDYVHRIGRTGRAGASGLALSLVTTRDLRSLAEIEKLTRRTLTPVPLELEAPVRAVRERRFDAPRAPRVWEGADRAAPVDAAVSVSVAAPVDDAEPVRVSRGPRRAPSRVDPFFLNPYVPEAGAEQETPVSTPQEAGGHVSVTGRRESGVRVQRAVLLGGRPPGLRNDGSDLPRV